MKKQLSEMTDEEKRENGYFIMYCLCGHEWWINRDYEYWKCPNCGMKQRNKLFIKRS